MDAGALLAQAEKAVGAGDLETGIRLLQQVAEQDGGEPDLWLRIAALHRRSGRPRPALDAVHRALALQPLDFTALMLRASLLDALGDPAAPEAWGNALANKPEGELPPPLAAAVARGEQRHAEWLAERERRMAANMAAFEAVANSDERRRIERFRNNVLRRTKPFHSQPTHFHFPELAEREFHPRALFPWLESVERATDAIARELTAVMAAERAELVPYIQYEDHLPLDQWKPLNKSLDWTAIHLRKNGERVEANARHCPNTMELLADLPQPRVAGAGPNSMFSLLAPRTRIPPHVGVSNARLVCHLPLVVPDGCWFRVGAETHVWKRGEAFVFDDTIEHEAMNPSDELRVVFILDVWHPDLSEVERDAVRALIEADGPGAGSL
ncbi:MAG: aspartyl/asparaginyl beta-hydroxylase domain-containing protein [Sphingomicrobium sp.]